MKPSQQSRLFEHEDLPLFSGQAPSIRLPEDRPAIQATQMSLVPVTTNRRIAFYDAMDAMQCGIGEPIKLWPGTEVEIHCTGKTKGRVLVHTVIEPKRWAWVNEADLDR